MRIQTALASALLASACTAAAPDALPVWKTKELPAVARARSWEDLLTRDFPTSRPVETLSKPATTGGDYRVVELTPSKLLAL